MHNSGIITNLHSDVNALVLEKYTNGKHSLVAQGGGQKGIFTSGVFDAFLLAESDPFDTFYGTSAGALNIAAFLCRQYGLGKAFTCELTTRPEFFHIFKHIRQNQRLNLDWIFDQLKMAPYALNTDVGRTVLGGRKAFATLTKSSDLQDCYLPLLGEDWNNVLKASCAIPSLYRQQITIEGENYVDGGVSAAIPAQEAWRQLSRLITIIRTEPIETTAILEDQEAEAKSFLNWMGLNKYIDNLQDHITGRTDEWRSEFYQFVQKKIQQKVDQSLHETCRDKSCQPVINGGRWLFGGGDVYRLCHLLGNKFDTGLVDMLMVHYQTYALTQKFMHTPPDDCFIIQIAPAEPLQSSSLMSKPGELEHDYLMGVEAGKRYLETIVPLLKPEDSKLTKVLA